MFTQFLFGQADSTFNILPTAKQYSGSKDIMPLFKGGDKAINKILVDNLKYPKVARKERVGGKVVVQFTIDTLGNVENIKVMESVRDDIDSEAIRLVSLLKGWTPGSSNEKKVKVLLKIPIHFYPDARFERRFKKRT